MNIYSSIDTRTPGGLIQWQCAVNNKIVVAEADLQPAQFQANEESRALSEVQ